MASEPLYRRAVVVALVTLLSCCGGCDKKSSRPDRDAMSPAEYFNKTQKNTVTPFGRVVPDSATDVGDRRIQFLADNGDKKTRLEVTATPSGEGYRYGNARVIEDDDIDDKLLDVLAKLNERADQGSPEGSASQ